MIASRIAATIAIVCALVTATAASAIAAAPPAKPRVCGQVTVTLPRGEGGAHRIRATRVSCERARQVARACVRGRALGWSVAWAPPPRGRELWGDRIILERGDARVTFYIAGGGGCA